ncbi:MAG: RNA polymerase sigma factor [Candidatus Pacebacteria bacterium]|nr:RNA polymerase sigma factor [Candidatus Paceibacterota bacterium]
MIDQRKEFGKIYDQCIDKIYRFVFLKVSSEDIAQDLCSETFLRGWEAYRVDATKIENPQAFLYRIARNLVTDYYREKSRKQTISADNLPIPDPRQTMAETAAINSDLARVKIALTDLREDYQNVIIWHYLEDLPIAEVAKMLDKTEDTTRVTLHRALKSLRETCNKKNISSSLLYDNA